MPSSEKKSKVTVTSRPRSSSEDSAALPVKAPSLKSPRTARFAEATAVNSPIEAPKSHKSPFDDPLPTPTAYYMAQPQVSDVGFGYVNKHESVEMPDTDINSYPTMPPKTPLKSAMKTPGAAPRDLHNILSPTFKEEQSLEKEEALTDVQQAKDLKVKTRVRIAKLFLRGVNFSCSLIVLSMLSTTFSIFNATRAIPPRNNLPVWAQGQSTWPQITLLCIACVSLVFSVVIIIGHCRGRRQRAEKVAVYYTAFAVAFFIFSIVMWVVGAGILQGSKTNGKNKDLWGWSCANNQRKQLFQGEVSYDLICTLQNWSLICCIIEVVVEVLTIAVYSVVFYRFWSKRKLRKSMAARDRARSDLYLAHLRSQSAPNTPGPLSARDGGWRAPMSPLEAYKSAAALEAGEVRYVDTLHMAQPKPFTLQPPPMKGATPKMAQVGFAPVAMMPREPSRTPPMEEDQRSPLMAPPMSPREQRQDHFEGAPGEQMYEAVPIPGAYEAPMSPGNENFPRSPR